jgi:hypothetical protein
LKPLRLNRQQDLKKLFPSVNDVTHRDQPLELF